MQTRPLHRRILLPLAVLLLAPSLATAAKAEWAVTISAGEFDRRDTPVAFDLPEAAPAGGTWELHDEAGGVTPAQFDGSKRVTFILKALKAGQQKTYRLTREDHRTTAVREPDAMAVKKGGVVKVTVGEQAGPRLPGRQEPRRRKGSRRSSRAAGTSTRSTRPPASSSPTTTRRTTSTTTASGTRGPTPSSRAATPTSGIWGTRPARSSSVGPRRRLLRPRRRRVHRQPPFRRPVGQARAEGRAERGVGQVSVYDDRRRRDRDEARRAVPAVRLESTQTCATDSPLVLPKYHYGGLGFRGAADWNEGADPHVPHVRGQGPPLGQRETARWVRISGKVGGRPAERGGPGPPRQLPRPATSPPAPQRAFRLLRPAAGR